MPFEPFLSPRLIGPRFTGGAIPLDALVELEAYADLVSAVARSLFFRRNPGRKRFRDEATLVLRGAIEEGSAAVQIYREVSQAQSSLPGLATRDVFDDARELVAQCVAAARAGEPMPDEFEPDLIHGFNRFGRRLRDGESVEIRAPNEKRGPVYDRGVRRKILAWRPDSTYEESVEIRGALYAVDADSKTFGFRLVDGPSIRGSYDPLWGGEIMKAIGAFDADSGVQSFIRGVAEYRGGRIAKLTQLHDVTLLGKPDPEEVAKMEISLSDLRRLSDGWLDGAGLAPPDEGLDLLQTVLAHALDEGLPCPRLYPVEEGGARAEWNFGRWDASAEFDFKANAAYLHALHLDTDDETESEIDLGDKDAAAALAAFVRKVQGAP